MRLLPDIFKSPLIYVTQNDVVRIPDISESELLARESGAKDDRWLPSERYENHDALENGGYAALLSDSENKPEDEENAIADFREYDFLNAVHDHEKDDRRQQRRREEDREKPRGEDPDKRRGGDSDKRREEDRENLDELTRRYRERVAKTRDEFFAEMEPDLKREMERQIADHREALRAREREKDKEIRRQLDEHRDELARALQEHKDDLARQLSAQREALLASERETKALAYQQELLSRREEINEALEALNEGLRILENECSAFIKEFSDELKFMAIDIAERITRKDLREDSKALEALVMEQVAEVKNASWINVEVSEKVKGLAEYLKTRLSAAAREASISVDARDVPPDTVRIVTEEGIVDASLSVQLRTLREAFVKAGEEGD